MVCNNSAAVQGHSEILTLFPHGHKKRLENMLNIYFIAFMEECSLELCLNRWIEDNREVLKINIENS